MFLGVRVKIGPKSFVTGFCAIIKKTDPL